MSMNQPNRVVGAITGITASLWLAACTTGSDAALPEAIASAPPAAEAVAAAPQAAEPTPLPTFSEDGIAALEARMAQFVEDGDVAGIETLLVHRGERVSHTLAGIRKAETGDPVTDDTIYRIYSMTKPVTSVAMLILLEEGAFELDDPITDYFPEFADLEVLTGPDESGAYGTEPLGRSPTVRELMSHQAGFAYGLFGDDPANTALRNGQVFASDGLEAFIDKIAGVPLLFQPGERWYYSVAVDIQGAMVERLSGQSFGAFLETRLFTRLGMHDTGFHVPDADYDRFSDVWGYHPETAAFGPVPGPRVAFRKETVTMESGGGGLVSTMDDYARFAQMLLNGGELDGVRILQPETVELMRTNVLPDTTTVDLSGTLSESDAATQRFGLNVGVYQNAEAFNLKVGEGTYYWGGAAGTWFWIDPVNELFFIGMIQRFAQGAPTPIDTWLVSQEHVYGALNTSDTVGMGG
ncbi:MAG: serine hydrolase domain-containing protein [Pseudomonadota bacterium]